MYLYIKYTLHILYASVIACSDNIMQFMACSNGPMLSNFDPYRSSRVVTEENITEFSNENNSI